MVRDVLLGSTKVFSSHYLALSLVRCKTSRGDFFYFLRVSFPSSLNGPQVDLLLLFFIRL